MSRFEKPVISQPGNEGLFEMVDNSRFVQVNYLPRRSKMEYDMRHDNIVQQLGRKVNQTLVYKRITNGMGKRPDFSFMTTSPV